MSAENCWRANPSALVLRSIPLRLEFVSDWHVLDATDEARAQPLHRSGQLRVIEALGEIAEDDFQLQPREVSAEAEMLADPECEMRIWVTSNVELERLIEDFSVAVRGRIEQAH